MVFIEREQREREQRERLEREWKHRESCKRSPGCKTLDETYQYVDCDGDGILDHTCRKNNYERRWLILSTEHCPRKWGTDKRAPNKCRKAFGK